MVLALHSSPMSPVVFWSYIASLRKSIRARYIFFLFCRVSRNFDLLSRKFDLVSRNFDLLTRKFDLCRICELISRIFEILSRIFELISRIFEILSRNFELISRIFELISRIFEILSRIFELISRIFEILSRIFELISRNFEIPYKIKKIYIPGPNTLPYFFGKVGSIFPQAALRGVFCWTNIHKEWLCPAWPVHLNCVPVWKDYVHSVSQPSSRLLYHGSDLAT